MVHLASLQSLHGVELWLIATCFQIFVCFNDSQLENLLPRTFLPHKIREKAAEKKMSALSEDNGPVMDHFYPSHYEVKHDLLPGRKYPNFYFTKRQWPWNSPLSSNQLWRLNHDLLPKSSSRQFWRPIRWNLRSIYRSHKGKLVYSPI